MLIVFSGLPGTGKTTIAKELAKRTEAVYLRIDTIEQALRNSGVLAEGVGRSGYLVANELALSNLHLGRLVVVDGVNPVSESREAWSDVAARAGVRLVNIQVVCTDKHEHQRRVETRAVDVPGLTLPTWQSVLEHEYEAWDEVPFSVDTALMSAAEAVVLITRSVLPAIKAADHAKVTLPARWTQAFDTHLSEIAHYQRHPYLLPWVGQHYSAQRYRVLVIGESHYLHDESTIHHDAVAWYERVVADQVSAKEQTWMRTRTVIHNGLTGGWKQRSKQIYRNIEAALAESAALDIPEGCTPFDCIAFLNFFQRPSERSGASISVKPVDIVHSTQVLRDVLTALKPDLVIFGSKLASRAARVAELRDAFTSTVFRTTPHPATSWWNRPMAKHKGKSGRELFVEAMKSPAAG